MKLDSANNTQTAPRRTANCDWASLVCPKDWAVYHDAIRALRKTGARFLLGGAFGLAGYTGRLRNTKDLDFFVLPTEKDKIVDSLTKAGFDDYYPQLAYDRGWIYRATRDGTIVDTIWQTPNRRTVVDGEWFQRSRTIVIQNERLEIIPAEELLAIKLYVLQRDRCDWPDLLNLLYSSADDLDWPHLVSRLGPDQALLNGLLQVFNWIAPDKARAIPRDIRTAFHLPEPKLEDLGQTEHRVRLIDSRPWFAAFQSADKPMQM